MTFPDTAIDDAARIRALKVYHRHTQANAIDFLDYVVEKFPFRIKGTSKNRNSCIAQYEKPPFYMRFHATIDI